MFFIFSDLWRTSLLAKDKTRFHKSKFLRKETILYRKKVPITRSFLMRMTLPVPKFSCGRPAKQTPITVVPKCLTMLQESLSRFGPQIESA
jgi:hypothetical protein